MAKTGYFKKKAADNSGPVEIIVISDRSGSTASIKSDIIGGYNAFIEEQRKIPGEANVTVVLFDDQYELLQDRVPLADAIEMTNENFVPRGMTAMNDAIGRTINRFKELHGKGEAKRAIIAILTDGDENASREYSGKQIKELVTGVQNEQKWQVVFLAANQDATLKGSELGVLARNTLSYSANSAGVRGASAAVSAYTTSYRNGGSD